METPFIIYIRAVGIYALLTLPAVALPIMYFISMMYVLFYGWFAWAVFTIIYVITIFCNPSYLTKMLILAVGVVVAVLFAFQMLEVLGVEQDIWHSGEFLLFPLAAVLSGWISLKISRERVRQSNRSLLLNVLEEGLNEEKISQ
jgi:hypothetical protein